MGALKNNFKRSDFPKIAPRTMLRIEYGALVKQCFTDLKLSTMPSLYILARVYNVWEYRRVFSNTRMLRCISSDLSKFH